MNKREDFFQEDYIVSCFKCGSDIKLIHPTHKLESAMWLDGIVDRIAAPYGSDFDGDMYIVGICDKCIKADKKTNKRLVYIGDYMMGSDDPDIEEVIEPYKSEILGAERIYHHFSIPCSNCDKYNHQTNNYCTNCGAEVDKEYKIKH